HNRLIERQGPKRGQVDRGLVTAALDAIAVAARVSTLATTAVVGRAVAIDRGMEPAKVRLRDVLDNALAPDIGNLGSTYKQGLWAAIPKPSEIPRPLWPPMVADALVDSISALKHGTIRRALEPAAPVAPDGTPIRGRAFGRKSLAVIIGAE